MHRCLASLVVWFGITSAEADPSLTAMATEIPVSEATTGLVARALGEGHWQFARRDGETFTASGAMEITRALSTLVPAAAGKPTIYVTQETAFGPPQTLAMLPGNAVLRLGSPRHSYGLLRREQGPPRIILTPAVLVEAENIRTFDQTRWHLARTIARTQLRVIALEPGGPTTLTRTPRLDAKTGKPQIDMIDPAALTDAVSAAQSELILLVGRVDAAGRELSARPVSSRSATVPLFALADAAIANDAGLMVLHAASPVQPGGRNWLWRTVDVGGLPAGATAPTLADLLPAMLDAGRVIVTARADKSRLLLDVRGDERTSGLGAPASWTRILGQLTDDMLGKAPATAITLTLPTAARQQELDRRWIKRLPAPLQLGYTGLLVLGLFGAPTAWRWWARIWPPEQAGDYKPGVGFHAARAIRGFVFAIAFMPLAAIVAAPFQLYRLVRRPA